ncbi:MAG: hypothetical protein ACPGVX_11415, partial [Thalassobaculaceae bacterium]
MVIDFLFLTTSVVFVFSTGKATIESGSQDVQSKILSFLFLTAIALAIPTILYLAYLWFMEMTIVGRIDFYIKFY